MKFTNLVLVLAATGAVAAVGYPIFSRVQTNRNRQEQRAQFAAKIRDSTPAQIERDNPRWFAAATAFDKNKTTAAAIFNGADKVEALRLFPVNSEKPLGQITQDVPFFSRHAVTNANFVPRLSDIVLNAKSYVLSGQSTTQCTIEPAGAFRVWKGAQFTDTVICFKCDQLAVLEHNETAPKRSIGGLLQGRFNVAGDFVVHPQLLALAKEAFPDDNAVQAIG